MKRVDPFANERKSDRRTPVEDEKRWARAWEVAGRYLEAERAQRLRTMTDDQAREEIARIFRGPLPEIYERRTGLVERQRLFMQLK